MPRLFLTPFVIAGLLLLPSCSSPVSSEQNSKTSQETDCLEVKKTYEDFSNILKKTARATDSYRITYLIQQYYVLENTECFSSLEIATAKGGIAFSQRKLVNSNGSGVPPHGAGNECD